MLRRDVGSLRCLSREITTTSQSRALRKSKSGKSFLRRSGDTSKGGLAAFLGTSKNLRGSGSSGAAPVRPAMPPAQCCPGNTHDDMESTLTV